MTVCDFPSPVFLSLFVNNTCNINIQSLLHEKIVNCESAQRLHAANTCLLRMRSRMLDIAVPLKHQPSVSEDGMTGSLQASRCSFVRSYCD